MHSSNFEVIFEFKKFEFENCTFFWNVWITKPWLVTHSYCSLMWGLLLFIFTSNFFLGFFGNKAGFIFLFLIYFITFGCSGPLLLCMGFLQLRQAEAALQVQCACFSLQRLLLWGSTGSRALRASVVAACELVVVVHGLSCLMTCGIFLDQGLKLCPLLWQVDS